MLGVLALRQQPIPEEIKVCCKTQSDARTTFFLHDDLFIGHSTSYLSRFTVYNRFLVELFPTDTHCNAFHHIGNGIFGDDIRTGHLFFMEMPAVIRS